jgi:(2R)-3-sulfolactate dehydrogenase (NADP+)
MRLSLAQARSLCEDAAVRMGANQATAHAIAVAAVDAQAAGQANVGLAHFLDYLAALRDGRIDGQAVARLSFPSPCVIASDAGGGAAQTGFLEAFDQLVAVARAQGLALFLQHNAYTCGALGWFAERLARQGLVALAATSGPALMASAGGGRPITCTNPIAFAAPVADAPPLLIDQASSETAFVNVRRAAAEGRPIPQGWAVDAEGRPTTDAAAAMAGALLPFGGARGANIALMVEVLAAGLGGANWALDAPSFTHGSSSPGSGLFVLAIDPTNLAPDFGQRMHKQMARLADDYGVHVPGRGKAAETARAESEGLEVDASVIDAIAGFSP